MRSPKSWAASTTGRRPSWTRSFHISVSEADIEPTRSARLIDLAEVEADKISKPVALVVYAATIEDDQPRTRRITCWSIAARARYSSAGSAAR